MHISYDRPSAITWEIRSLPSNNAAFVTSSSYLNDGKVAIPARITWDTGAQTTASYVTFFPGLGTYSVPAGKFVFALLMPNTQYAVPAGTKVIFSLDTSAGGFLGTFSTVQLNNGSVAAFGVLSIPSACTINSGHLTSTFVRVYNSTSGASPTTWAMAGQTVDIGEIWFGSLHEFKTATDPKIALLGGPTERRSHSNQPQPLMRNPYRQLQASLVAMDEASAFTGTYNFEAVRYALTTTKAALVIPRLNERGTTTLDQTAVNQQTIFGRPSVSAFGPLAAVKDSGGLWTASLTVEESPP